MRQRGNIYVVLALVIATGVALTGLVLAWNHYTAELDKKGFDRGVLETTAAYQKRDNADLQTAVRRIQALQEAARAAEAGHAAELSKIGDQLTKERANAKAEQNRIAADIAAGRLLRRDDAYQTRAQRPEGGGDPVGPAGAAAVRGDGAQVCELSAKAQGSVLDIGADADEVVKQLTACQAVILEDRRLCGPINQPPVGGSR